MAKADVSIPNLRLGWMLQALSAAIVAFAGLYIRSLYTIRPDAVYRKALVQLNTSPAILEVGSLTAG